MEKLAAALLPVIASGKQHTADAAVAAVVQVVLLQLRKCKSTALQGVYRVSVSDRSPKQQLHWVTERLHHTIVTADRRGALVPR